MSYYFRFDLYLNRLRSARVLDFFFFQAEDGIRDHCVTGVQTCALPICTFGQGDGSLGVLPQGHERNSQVSRLLLHAAGIGYRDRAAHHEIHEFDVTQRFDDADRQAAGDGLEEAEVLETPAGTGVDGEHDRELTRQLHERADQLGELVALIDIGRAVQRDDGEWPLEIQAPARVRSFDFCAQHLERVDHDVADAVDLVCRDALGQQVGVCIPGGRPQKIADRIGYEAIDLLGHAPVAAAQAGLQVHDRDPQLRPNHGAGGGRIDVAHHHNGVRTLALAHNFVSDHGASGLLRVRAAADFQVMGRLRQAQVAEEGLRHVRVIVLAGVHDARGAPAFPGQCVVQGRHLHEVRARGGDQMDDL